MNPTATATAPHPYFKTCAAFGAAECTALRTGLSCEVFRRHPQTSLCAPSPYTAACCATSPCCVGGRLAVGRLELSVFAQHQPERPGTLHRRTIGEIEPDCLPVANGFAAMQRHHLADTDAVRARVREEVPSTTVADVRAFAGIASEMVRRGCVVVIGSKTSIESASQRPGLLAMAKLL
jgi:hypothetical protein